MSSRYNNALEFSLYGSTIASSGSGSFGALQCLEETVLHSVGATGVTTPENLVGITLAAGTTLFGKYNSFTTSNGAMIAAHNRYA